MEEVSDFDTYLRIEGERRAVSVLDLRERRVGLCGEGLPGGRAARAPRAAARRGRAGRQRGRRRRRRPRRGRRPRACHTDDTAIGYTTICAILDEQRYGRSPDRDRDA